MYMLGKVRVKGDNSYIKKSDFASIDY